MAGMFARTGSVTLGRVSDGPMLGYVDVLINRDTIFGNKYHIGVDGTRAEVCAKYEKLAKARMLKNGPFAKRIHALRKRYSAGESIRLLCHCFPKQCHGLTVMKLIKGQL